MPRFFIPDQTLESQEEVYSQLARAAGLSIPEHAKRIYSIKFRHDGAEWIAIVGKSLHGAKTKTQGRGINKREVSVPVSDSAIVLAIFSGYPFTIYTDSGISNRSRSAWSNPFYTSAPSSISYFDT